MKRLHYKTIRNILAFAIPVAFLSLLIAAGIILFSYSYDSFLKFALASLQRPDLENKIRTIYFTKEKFEWLRIWVVAFCGVGSLGFIYLSRKKESYFHFIDSLLRSFQFYFHNFFLVFHSFGKAKIFLIIGLMLLLIRSVYYANTFYIQYDESWNYNYFLDRNIFFSIGAYNNYPLHNVVSWFFVKIFGNSVWVLRLPSILMGLISTFYLSVCLLYFFKNTWVAIWSAFIFSCLPVSLFYMMYARGVMFEIFFALLVTSLLVYYTQNGFSHRRIFFLCCLNALGTLSMLSHPYFICISAMALFVFGIIHSRKFIVSSIAYFFGSILMSIVCLLPMILGTGLSSGLSVVHGNEMLSLKIIMQHISEYSSFITGFENGFNLLFIISLIIFFISLKKKPLVLMMSLLLILSYLFLFILPFATKIFPPQRALSFLVFVPILVSAIVLQRLQIHFKTILINLLPITLISILSVKAQTHHFLQWSKELDKTVFDVAVILKHEKIKSVYNDCRDFDYFLPGIEYYYKRDKMEISFTSSSPQSTRYISHDDTLADAIVIDKLESKIVPSSFSKIFDYGNVVVYKKNHLPNLY